MALFYIFANISNVWLNIRWLHSQNCFYILSLAISGLVEVYEYNSASHRNEVEKGGFSISLLGNNGYFSLVMHQNLKRVSFVKVRCNVESEIISTKFVYSVTLKPTGIFAT